MTLKRIFQFPLLHFVCCILLSSCSIYSFTGASISADTKTICIKTFPNYAPLIQPTLSQTFTEALKDRFVSQTSLGIVKNDGDLTLEGSIIDYKTAPAAIASGDQASLIRLTIGVKVKFTNKKDPKQDFEQVFSNFADYPSSQNLTTVEGDLIKQINEKLINDIFNKAVVNW